MGKFKVIGTVTLDFDAATENVVNASTAMSNVASLTIDGDASYDVDLGSLSASALTTLVISAEANAVDTGNLTAAALKTITATAAGAGGGARQGVSRAPAVCVEPAAGWS